MTATAGYGRAESQNLEQNMSSAQCAASMFSRLCMKMSSFLFFFIFKAVFIGILTMNYCIIKYCKAEYVKRSVCFANIQSSLHENVIFSFCARMGNDPYIMFFNGEFHFRFRRLVSFPV